MNIGPHRVYVAWLCLPWGRIKIEETYGWHWMGGLMYTTRDLNPEFLY